MAALPATWWQELRRAGPLKLAAPPPSLKPDDLVPVIAVGRWAGRILAGLVDFWARRGLEPETLPFLWVDVTLPGEGDESLDLPAGKKVILTPPSGRRFRADLEALHQNAFFSWLPTEMEPSALWNHPRLAGRALFYWELMRGELSPLVGRLLRLLEGKAHEHICLLAAAWERPVTGFLIDLAAAHLHYANTATTRVDIWLLGPVPEPPELGTRRLDAMAMQQETAALLWEIARFQRARGVPFQFSFAPPTSRSSQSRRVALEQIFTRVYYFEGEQAERHIEAGLRLLVGSAQEEYQKRLLNYFKDWPPVNESEPLDGLFASFGAHLRSALDHSAERAFWLLFLSGLLHGPGGLLPQAEGLLVPLEDFQPQIREAEVHRLVTELDKGIRASEGGQAYTYVARRIMAHLNPPRPAPQGQPLQEGVEILQRLLRKRAAPWPRAVRQGIEDLLARLEKVTRELRNLGKRWRAEWQKLPRIHREQEALLAQYQDIFAPAFDTTNIQSTFWYRVRQRVAWGLVPKLRPGKRVDWRVGFLLIPPELPREEADVWGFFHERVDEVARHWRNLARRLPLKIPLEGQHEDFRAFWEEVREHFADMEPAVRLGSSPHIHVPKFYQLAVVVTRSPMEGERLARFLRDEAPDRFPEVVTVTDPALGGYGMVLHKEPFPFPILTLWEQIPTLKPQMFAHRGEQLNAWLVDFPVFSGVAFTSTMRTWLENEEPWLLPWTQGWVLLGTPPRLPAWTEEQTDEDLYQELQELLQEQCRPLQGQAAPPQTAWPTPEQPLQKPDAFPPFKRFLDWWHTVHTAPSERREPWVQRAWEIAALLREWGEEAPESMQTRAQYALDSYFPPDDRRWRRRFRHRLASEQQQALLWWYVVARLLVAQGEAQGFGI